MLDEECCDTDFRSSQKVLRHMLQLCGLEQFPKTLMSERNKVRYLETKGYVHNLKASVTRRNT
ncbi:hypothetical protein DEO72_LG8g800 [Vigna unguiculata]|uniref:Uncharacterized protein n=1 Tax=Vigna unguiculata TaxID=3917 RepID=A0A4D6MSC7_VIGUN|nr:hypothetical protein DEO72_LG8g800 [Vigna unguiculata]